MKNYLLPLFLFQVLYLVGCSSSPNFNQEIISYEGEPILVNLINREGLNNNPYSSWFNEFYQDYQLDKNTLDIVRDKFEGVEIVVVMGTWCSDSQMQVPEFYKMLDYLDFPFKKLTVIGVENHPDRYLKSPEHKEERFNIEFVPTFIFYKSGKELGRIVEFPQETLEKDMAEILEGNAAE